MATKLAILFVGSMSLLTCGGNTGSDNDGDDGTADGMDWADSGSDQVNPGDGSGSDLTDTSTGFDGEICGEQEFSIARVIPDMLILLDRSLSMTMSEPPLWDIIRPAITTVTSSTDDSVWFGLMAFSNSIPPNECSGGSNQCTPPTDPLVPVGPGTSGDIQSALAALDTCGATPTAPSLESAHQYLLTVTDDHPKYILLATDGAPNCNDSLDGDTCRCTTGDCRRNSQYCLDDARTLTTLDGICSDDIKTFVLGMGGATDWEDVLQEMATHGCTDTFYAAQDPAEIQAALEAIAGGIASCQFELTCSEIPDVYQVNFYFDGTIVPMNPSRDSGWDWVVACDPGTETGIVEFFGSDCDSIMSGAVESVSAAFGCPTQLL